MLWIDPLSLIGDTRPVGGRIGQYRLHPQNYGVVDGDPDTPGETFAYGFRSPYRINVDQSTGNIYVGDVGENSREEVSRIVNGGNYGWRYEGSQLVRSQLVPGPGEPPHSPPVWELYHNLSGQSEAVNVVGGFVYRGSAIPAPEGKYVFADTGENEFTQPTNVLEIYYGDPATTSSSTRDDLFRLGLELPAGLSLPDRIWSIAEDDEGELYLLVGPKRNDLFVVSPGETDGAILKLVAPAQSPNGLAGDVNQDGLVDASDVIAMKQGWYTGGHSTALAQYTHGDLNFDGITDLKDLFALHQALQAAGQSVAELAAFQASVPEPNAMTLGLLGTLALAFRRGRRQD